MRSAFVEAMMRDVDRIPDLIVSYESEHMHVGNGSQKVFVDLPGYMLLGQGHNTDALRLAHLLSDKFCRCTGVGQLIFLRGTADALGLAN